MIDVPCSTPYGISASGGYSPQDVDATTVGAQRLTASQRAAAISCWALSCAYWVCSTPYGISASGGVMTRAKYKITPRVLNALRHLSERRVRVTEGVRNVVCAQRLTASQRAAVYVYIYVHLGHYIVLNALRHLSERRIVLSNQGAHLSNVLNALRHLSERRVWIRARLESAKGVLNALRHLSERRGHKRHLLDAALECSTPYGISASGGVLWIASAWLEASAQRLTASQRAAGSGRPGRRLQGPRAQRLTASQRAAVWSWRPGSVAGGGAQRLTASQRAAVPRWPRWSNASSMCSTPYGISASGGRWSTS